MKKNKNKVIFLVVLYNKEVSESKTVNSLMDFDVEDFNLLIFNNGPKEISLTEQEKLDFSSKGLIVKLVNSTNNKPLAKLYNDFLDDNPGFNKYIILDDDSELTSSYISSLNHDDYDIEIPKIVSKHDHLVYYPISNGAVITNNGFVSVDGTHSIGSGLVINHSLLDVFKNHNMKLFDENFALYGVDVSLFRRMWILSNKGVSIKVKSSSSLVHSLSRLEGKESDFRRHERVIDFAISVRRYPSVRSYLSFIKKMIISASHFRIKDMSLMLTCFIKGSHPRCRTWRE